MGPEQSGRPVSRVAPGGGVRAVGHPAGGDPAAALRAALAGRRVLVVLDDVVSAAQLTGVLPAGTDSLVVATSGGPLAGVADVRPSTLGGLETPAAVALLGQAVGSTRVTNDPRGAEALVQEVAGHPTALRLIGPWLAARPRLSLSEAAARLRAAQDTAPAAPPAVRATDGLAPLDLAESAPGTTPRATSGARPEAVQKQVGSAAAAAFGRPRASTSPAAPSGARSGAGQEQEQASSAGGGAFGRPGGSRPPGAGPGVRTGAVQEQAGSPAAAAFGRPGGSRSPGAEAVRDQGGSRLSGPASAAAAPASPAAEAAAAAVGSVTSAMGTAPPQGPPPGSPAAPGPDLPPAPATPRELVRAFRLIHQDLPATAARILRLLVLAPAGQADAHVASALAGCSVSAAQATLDDFVAGGLLTPGAGEGRYRLPACLEPLLRDLVASQEHPEDVRLARARMLERTVRLLLSCRAALAGEPPADGLPGALRFGSPEEARRWLEARLPALMAAARAAVADGELDTLARRLVAALVRALVAVPAAAPAIGERYELHRLVLDVAERRGLHREQAAALINLADLDAESGRPEDALDKYRQALGPARAGGDTEAEGRILEALGSTYLARQDLSRAMDWFGRALALRQARGELGHQARLHARIGSVQSHLGRFGPALREWRAAAGVHRRLGDLPAQARALAEAARVQEYAGHSEDALRTCRDALHWARQAGERRLEAAVLLRLADALDRLGDPSGAALQRAAARRLLQPGEFPAF
ncbi:ATP-binding protein [Streptomyces sp. NBC_01190]|uniref:ATP-binding protein n=1 Tax=Streptomyces sp. NBC_01190 TaxID=2903767 RepID=UPI003868D247|nr:ATP-binding protein [Streptomyces sp. NBC_01190]